MLKRCPKCGDIKDSAEFSRDKSRKDGFRPLCKSCTNFVNREWRRRNIEKARDASKQWKANNPKKAKKMKREWSKRYRHQPKAHLSHSMGRAVWKLFREKKGGQAWERLVGYNTDKLKKHLEKQFTEGMTWDNYGEWHVDHKVPVSAFNFNKPEDLDFKRCWALKNLQPMWREDNIAKSDNLDKPFQPSLPLAVNY